MRSINLRQTLVSHLNGSQRHALCSYLSRTAWTKDWAGPVGVLGSPRAQCAEKNGGFHLVLAYESITVVGHQGDQITDGIEFEGSSRCARTRTTSPRSAAASP